MPKNPTETTPTSARSVSEVAQALIQHLTESPSWDCAGVSGPVKEILERTVTRNPKPNNTTATGQIKRRKKKALQEKMNKMKNANEALRNAYKNWSTVKARLAQLKELTEESCRLHPEDRTSFGMHLEKIAERMTEDFVHALQEFQTAK